MKESNARRHAYLILIHDNIAQVNELLSLLDHERNDLFVHIDKNSHLDVSEVGMTISKSNIHVFKEISVYWSHVSLTEAELFLLETAVSKGPYQYYHLLSGADLPIKPQSYILDFFDKHDGKEFVEYQVPGKFLDKPYYDRIRYYHVLSKYYRIPGRLGKVLSYGAIAIEYFCIFWQYLFRIDRIGDDIAFARGSQWFDITDDLARYVVGQREDILKRFKMTRASDESFLPLIVHNSHFRERLFLKTFNGDMRANMRFIDWQRGDPYLFKDGDFEELMASELLFARKFDQRKYPGVVKKIIDAVKE